MQMELNYIDNVHRRSVRETWVSVGDFVAGIFNCSYATDAVRVLFLFIDCEAKISRS
jgi:hypothetical protein